MSTTTAAVTLTGDELRQFEAQIARPGSATSDASNGPVAVSGPVVLVVPGDWDHDDSVGLYGSPYVDAPQRWADLAGERAQIYAECDHDSDDCSGSVLVARATVDVLPVRVDFYNHGEPGALIVPSPPMAVQTVRLARPDHPTITLDLPKPWPVPGRDFVVVLSAVERG